MGFSKALRKVFRSKKKKDFENSENENFQNQQNGGFQNSAGFDQIWSFDQKTGESGFERGKSVRRGIYEPYRQHFPVKSSQYDAISPYEPQQTQKQNYGPKLVTADGTYNQNGEFTPAANYSEHRIPNLTRSSSNASLCQFQNNAQNYQMFQTRQFQNPHFGGSQLNLSSSGPNFRRPARSNSTLSNYEVAAFQQHQIPRAASVQRQGSLSSIPTFTSNNYQFHKPAQLRPSSVIGGQFNPPQQQQQQLPNQQTGNYEMQVARPQRPSSAQGGFFSNYEMSVHSFESAPPVMSPVSSNYPSTRSSSFINNRVMSPVGSSSMSNAGDAPAQFEQQVFTLSQLRSSQANLQQALRAQEDILRQNAATQNTAELDTTMKIMQTCLDMLDSISGLVERSTTPVPMQNQPMAVYEPEKPFINHQMKPKKSALKQRKLNSSAFEKVAPKINAEIVSDLSDFENNQSAESEIETPDLSFQTSPGPSELSEDSGFERAASASPAKKLADFKPMLSSLSQLKISQM